MSREFGISEADANFKAEQNPEGEIADDRSPAYLRETIAFLQKRIVELDGKKLPTAEESGELATRKRTLPAVVEKLRLLEKSLEKEQEGLAPLIAASSGGFRLLEELGGDWQAVQTSDWMAVADGINDAKANRNFRGVVDGLRKLQVMSAENLQKPEFGEKNMAGKLQRRAEKDIGALLGILDTYSNNEASFPWDKI